MHETILPLLVLVLFAASGCGTIILGAILYDTAPKKAAPPTTPTPPAMINEELEAMGLSPLPSDVESQKAK